MTTDYRVRRADLEQSVADSDGWSVYSAIVARIDWSQPAPWLALLHDLNPSQRAVVALGQLHEHAAFNGLEAAIDFHGLEITAMAAEGADAIGDREIRRLLDAGTAASKAADEAAWEEIETEWDRVSFGIVEFIESHPDDFFVD